MDKNEDENDHDPKTCFRCRLYELWSELKNENSPRFMLAAMAEASGSILSQMSPDDVFAFLQLVVATLNEDMPKESQEGEHKYH